MKTRIISGIVMGVLVAVVLAVGLLLYPSVITLFVAALAGAAAYELVHNAAGITSKLANIGAILYTAAMVIAFDFKRGYFLFALQKLLGHQVSTYVGILVLIGTPFVISIFYFLFAVCMVLKNHRTFGLGQIGMLCGMLLPLSFAFNCLNAVIRYKNGLYYLLLALVFSSICDMGAYFVGVTLGKHKLCPEISPKKTVEGAVGGIVCAMIFVVILMLCFAQKDHFVVTLVLTVPFCIVGMLGDLFASAITRSVDLKDYSNLIPGHGGIMDRLDSVLLIVPLLYFCMVVGVI